MEKRFIIIVVKKRKKEAVVVQKILTEWGCFIKTRLGLHEDIMEKCSETGTIFLELVGKKEKLTELKRKLNLLDGVYAQMIEFVD